MRICSTDISKLYAALGKAQAKFPVIPKNKTVEVKDKVTGRLQYSYKYADLADILQATRAALTENGLTITQPFFDVEGGKKALVTRIDHAESEEWVEFHVQMPSVTDMKLLAGNLTYLRRYGIQGALGVAADEDTDGLPEEVEKDQNRRASGNTGTPRAPNPPRPPQNKAVTEKPAVKRPDPKPEPEIVRAPEFVDESFDAEPIPPKPKLATDVEQPWVAAWKASGWKDSEVKMFIKLAYGKDHSSKLTSLDKEKLVEALKFKYTEALLKYGKKPGEEFKPASPVRERSNPDHYEREAEPAEDDKVDEAWEALGDKRGGLGL